MKTNDLLLIGGVLGLGAIAVYTYSKKQDTRTEQKTSVEPEAVGIASVVDAGKYVVSKGGSLRRGMEWVINPINALGNLASEPVRAAIGTKVKQAAEKFAESPTETKLRVALTPLKFAPVVGQIYRSYAPIGSKATSWLYQKTKGVLS